MHGESRNHNNNAFKVQKKKKTLKVTIHVGKHRYTLIVIAFHPPLNKLSITAAKICDTMLFL